jgi:hypothetical protein
MKKYFLPVRKSEPHKRKFHPANKYMINNSQTYLLVLKFMMLTSGRGKSLNNQYKNSVPADQSYFKKTHMQVPFSARKIWIYITHRDRIG